MPRRRLARRSRTRLFIAALLVALTWGSWSVWDHWNEQGASFGAGAVEHFLDARLAALSDSVYRVEMGTLHLDPRRHAARIDTILVYTDTARNRRLKNPYPVLRLLFSEAEVLGLVPPSKNAGLKIDEVRFSKVAAELSFLGGDPAAPRRAPVRSDSGSPPIIAWNGTLPPGVPEARIGRVILQGITATVRANRGPVQRVERLSLILDSLRLDPSVAGAHRPILVSDIRLFIAKYSGGWDSTFTLTVGELQGSFRDSTLRIRNAALAPRQSITETFRRAHYRKDRFTVRMDSLSAAGVDWRSALREGAIPMRSLTLDGADFVVYSDKRLAPRPGTPNRKPLLQETLGRFGRPVALDTIRIRNGRVRYQERSAKGTEAGELDFQDLEASLTGLRWIPGERSDRIARLDLNARLWGVGRLALIIRAPVGSPKPLADLDLFVGPMPLILFNRIATQVAPVDIKGGTLDSLRVRGTITGDRAVGEVRPYYHDLGIRAAGHTGGVFGWLKRNTVSVVANSFVVRDDNPDKDGEMMVGPFDRTRLPAQTFWPFAWTFTRDGLVAVSAGKGVVIE